MSEISSGECDFLDIRNRISPVNWFFLFSGFLFSSHAENAVFKNAFHKSVVLLNYLLKSVPLRSIPQMHTRSFLQAAVAAALWQRPLLFFFE